MQSVPTTNWNTTWYFNCAQSQASQHPNIKRTGILGNSAGGASVSTAQSRGTLHKQRPAMRVIFAVTFALITHNAYGYIKTMPCKCWNRVNGADGTKEYVDWEDLLCEVAYALYICANAANLYLILSRMQYVRYGACTPMSDASCRASGSGYCVNCTLANNEQYASHSPCNTPAPRRGIWAVSSIYSLHVRQ